MEKAKLTQAQADAARELVEFNGASLAVMIFADYLNQNRKWSDADFVALNELDADTFFRSIYVGYEILEEEQTITITEKIREELRENFEPATGIGVEPEWTEGYQSGMKDTLQALGIIVNGINDKEARR